MRARRLLSGEGLQVHAAGDRLVHHLSGSCQTPASPPPAPLPGPKKGKPKILFLPLSAGIREGEQRVIWYCVLGPTLPLT